MTKPEESLRKVIDDQSVRPRLQNQDTYLVAAGPDPLPVGRADRLYLWDEYGVEYLDFASLQHPVGHSHPSVASAIAEHGRYYR